MSTLAVLLALGLGSAWAFERNSVESKHIDNGAIRTVDVKNRNLKGKDLRLNTLRGREVWEERLSGTGIIQVGQAVPATPCDPAPRAVCASVHMNFRSRSVILVTAAALARNRATSPSASDFSCAIERDSAPLEVISPVLAGGDAETEHGIALSGIANRVNKGPHKIALACDDAGADVRITDATLTVLAISDRGAT